jgi:tyrosine-protein kinase Etk/Wzc
MSSINKENPDNEILLSFSDLLYLIKKNKRLIGICSLAFALLAMLYGLTKPIEYEVEGSFKEKGKSSAGISSSLSTMLMMPDLVDSNALTAMRSRKLIEELIKEQNLQGIIIKNEYRFPLIPFQKIKSNILIEYALFTKKSNPILNDPKKELKVENIWYNGEVPKALQITLLTENNITIQDAQNEPIKGTIGKPISTKDYSFVLNYGNAPAQENSTFTLLLLPLEKTAEITALQFKIEPDKTDKNLLKITYRNADRQLAAENLNTLMFIYQKSIEKEHQLISDKQISYLLKRQKEMAKILETMMQAYADDLSLDLSSTGFATSEKAMDFLAASQQELKRQLFTLDLQIQRLQRAQNDTNFNNDVFTSVNNLEVINKLATEKRSLKQQADSLNLVLRNLPSQLQEFKNSFKSQLEDIERIKKALNASNSALAKLQKNELPMPSETFNNDSKSIFNTWLERSTNAQNNLKNNPKNKDCLNDWEQCKSGFISYLSNLNHYLNVYQRNIEERLAHQQAPLKEFQGINLNVARDLYISYNKELSDAESLAAQHEFIANQIDEPNFEISSLSSILTDPLSISMITRTSDLILALKDQDNRSSREQERLNADLSIQKGFLKTHIQQTIDLLKLRQKFLKEKIQRLQSLNLSLIQEQISILENQIQEHINSTLENLNQEKMLIENNLTELRYEMAIFPQKWASEQLIDQQMQINKSLVEEISKLVESKNISNNLEKLQSSPLDLAYPPIHPRSPRIALLTIFGAVAGSIVSFMWILAWSIINGICVSQDNLKTAGQYVCGTISRQYQGSLKNDPLLDSDLAALRRLIAFFESQNKNASNTLLLLQGKGPYYAYSLAELLFLKGLKILVIELNCEKLQEGNKEGLLQYLEGKIDDPAIQHLSEYDKISTGGLCRYANELIGSKRFNALLEAKAQKYDWIIVSSNAMPCSAEAESLLDLFPNAVISVVDETLQDLKNCLSHANQANKKIAFMMKKNLF